MLRCYIYCYIIITAQELLNRAEPGRAKVGLRPNAKRTQVITSNVPPEHQPLTAAGAAVLTEDEDFHTWAHGPTLLSEEGVSVEGLDRQMEPASPSLPSPLWQSKLDPEAIPPDVS